MQLLRNLLVAATRQSFSFSAQHVHSVNNQIADAMSRFHWQAFKQLVLDHPGGFDIFTLEQQRSSFLPKALLLPVVCVLLPKQSLFPFAVSWESYILQGPPAQQMNGHFTFNIAFSSLFLLVPFSIPLSRCTSLGLELSTLNKGSLICL